MKPLFTDTDLARIKEAVSEAEGITSGEIVPYFVPRSGRYEVAQWRGAVGLAVVALAGLGLLFRFYEGWGWAWLFTGWGTALVALAAGVLGAALTAFVPPLKRLLAGSHLLARTVHDRALRAFVEEAVFDTRDRTGILLFISSFERRIEVVGDEGINRRVAPEDWAEIVLRIRQGIREGRPADGLVEAIGMCGHLLRQKGVEIRPDDTNELPDGLRFGDET